MVAPNLPTAPSLPCLKTDLCPDRSLEAETAGLKMVKKKGGKMCICLVVRRPNVLFLYRTVWDAHRIDPASSDWLLPSTTFVYNQTFALRQKINERVIVLIARRWQKGWNLKLGSGQTPIKGGVMGRGPGVVTLLGDPVFSLWARVTSFPFQRDSPSSHNPCHHLA